MREIVRSCDANKLTELAKDNLERLVDEISSVARDDAGSSGRREKAAEFLIHVRSHQSACRNIGALIDQVAESAASARYRSGRIIDFVSTWLFIAGEQYVATIDDHSAMLEMEIDHPHFWNRFRLNILETLEAGSQRLAEGRRFRLAEEYLARMRHMRTKTEERLRSDQDLVSPESRYDAVGAEAGPDYVATMIVDIFALSLTERQQTLVVAQIPDQDAGVSGRGFAAHDDRRLWGPIRAVRSDQGREQWTKLRQELGVSRRQAIQELASGLTVHLKRTWEWFFPHRHPFGMLRATLVDLENSSRQEVKEEQEDAFVGELFKSYSETLSFIARLATDDLESTVQLAGDETAAPGVV